MSELLLFLASGLASLLQALLCAVGLLACLSVSLLWYTSRYPVKPMPHYTEPLVFAPEPDQPLLQGNDATQDFAHLIVRDFIRTWHNVLVQGETSQDALAFPMLIEDRISSCVNALFLRASTSDWLKFLMKHAMPTIVEHIRRFEQAELDTYGTQKTTAFHHKFDELLLASKYQGPLHPAVGTTSSLDSKVSELVYLRTLSERLLRALTPAHYTWTPTSMALVREVLSCSILYPVIDMASDPDWINEMVLQTLQHRLKRNLSAKSHSDKGHTMHSPPQTQGKTHPSRAVAGSQAKNGRKKYNKIEHTKSTSTDKWTSFRALLAATNSLLELHRIRDGLLLELDRRQSEEVRGTDQKNGKGKASSAGAIRRIQLALNLVQERVEQIEGKQVEPSPSDSVSSPLSPSRSTSVTLLDTLHDSVGLSNFIEFMERRNRSPLIQFWIFVNAFKDPLEQVDINVEAQLTEKSWKSTQGNQTTLMSADSDLLRDTIGTILAYYESPIFPVRQACRLIAEIASAYSTDLLFSEHQVYLIKQSVFLAQMDALDLMLEYDWGLFQDSLLFHQFFNHFRTLNAPPTHSPNAPEWDTDSNDSMADHVEANLLHDLLHDDRIPIQYGFLLGQGDGSRTKGNSLFRKPLFDQDPLFLEDTVSKDKQQSQDDTHSILLENSDQQSHSAHTILPRSVKTLSDTSLGEYRQYSMRITQLQDKLRNLKKQAELAEVMLSKAELAGSSADEIHVLEQSKDMIECDTTRIDREIQALRTRMIRYNRIFDPDPKQKVTVFINDTSLCQDEPGQPYILYIVTVQLCTPNAVNDEPIIRSWTVSRRYSAFRELHQALKKRFRAARMYDMMFPGRKFVGSTTSTYVETRRKALEKYLQLAISNSEIRTSRIMKLFLSDVNSAPDQKMVDPTWFETVLGKVTGFADGVDNLVGEFRPSMFDTVLQQVILSYNNLQDKDMSLSSKEVHFIAPLCDFFIVVFKLNQKAEWLRRKAILVVLKNLLGSTIQSWLNTMLQKTCAPKNLKAGLHRITAVLWPDGDVFKRRTRVTRTWEEQNLLHTEAASTLATFISEYADHILGQDRAKLGAHALMNVVQNRRLNKHLIYELLDDMVDELTNEHI